MREVQIGFETIIFCSQ